MLTFRNFEILKFWNLECWNFEILNFQISKFEILKFWNFEILKFENLKIRKLKIWNLAIWNFEIWKFENRTQPDPTRIEFGSTLESAKFPLHSCWRIAIFKHSRPIVHRASWARANVCKNIVKISKLKMSTYLVFARVGVFCATLRTTQALRRLLNCLPMLSGEQSGY